MSSYMAWLIEYRGTGTKYFALTNLLEPVWVDDADDAFHFARREDCDRVSSEMPIDLDIHICDHLWPEGPPRKPTLLYSENWTEPNPASSSQGLTFRWEGNEIFIGNVAFGYVQQCYYEGRWVGRFSVGSRRREKICDSRDDAVEWCEERKDELFAKLEGRE